MKSNLKQNGITLIALVITIIVLLILAGVSIAMVSGENGILTKASTAKTKTRASEVNEYAELIRGEYAIDHNGENATAYYIIQELLSQNRITQSEILDDGDGKASGKLNIDGQEVIISGVISIASYVTKYITIDDNGKISTKNPELYYAATHSNSDVTYNSKNNFPTKELVIPEQINGITVTGFYYGSSNKYFYIGKGVEILELPSTVTSLPDSHIIYCAPDLKEIRCYSNLSDIVDNYTNNGYLDGITITYLDK